ncbi:MAG: serine O-acetyltransferase EpsC [Bdellovibrionota bacterium]
MSESKNILNQPTGVAAFAERAANSLEALYAFDETDRPEKALGSYPNAVRVIESLKILIDVMLPGRLSAGISVQSELQPFLRERLQYVGEVLGGEIEKAIPFRWLGHADKGAAVRSEESVSSLAEKVLGDFFGALPDIRSMIIDDIRAAYQGDPAALSFAEVQIAYPGLLAVASHRLAHQLYLLQVPIVPRIMSEWIHTQTGVDIHPGARIGAGFFIDHGTGVVIGETTVIGKNVRLYQGSTLGARAFALDENGQPVKHIKRHPTVEDDVTIYANAIILGGETVIGKGSTIGGGVMVMESVPPGSLVVATRPELKIKRSDSFL